MQHYLQLFIWLPLLGFFASLLIPAKKERALSALAIGTVALQLLAAIIFITSWLLEGRPLLDIKHIVLYHSPTFEFFIDFYFDLSSAVYLFVGSLLTLMVSLFSRYYMHRDRGFKRFFIVLLLFFLGYNLVIIAGNFETLFIGWEILGFCSFLLIAFYRDRYLPVKNALKVISVYRLGDVCLVLAMWMCHHLFHANITFFQLLEPSFINNQLAANQPAFLFVAIMIVVAAAAKSALLPFSSWLPRAMEGPTTSSAIFYGSLSVHLGAFLLIRSYPLWEQLLFIKILIIVLGLATSLVASGIASVQSTVKTQIAYASITQMGLIFVEVALGLHWLALIHFAGNAFLRTYQLLVSPSVLSYRIHDMFFSFKGGSRPARSFQRLRNMLYVMNVREWNLDGLQFRLCWYPFKWLGQKTRFMVRHVSIAVLSVFFLLGLYSFSAKDSIPVQVADALPVAFALVGLLLVLSSFAERGDARRAWLFVLGGQGFITLSIILNSHVPFHQVWIYLGAVLVAAVAGLYCIEKLKKSNTDITLNGFHGYAYDHPVLSFIFLLCCLASFGFPLTPTFLGIDLLFTHIHQHQVIMVTLTALSFIFIELAILRIYSRLFLGPHRRNDHPIAFRSS